MMTTFFMEFLRILDISIKTQSKNILFFADGFSVVKLLLRDSESVLRMEVFS
jgi:hypothetical protein